MMKKKLWSADSDTWFGLALLCSAGGFAFGALVSTTWLLLLITLLLLAAAIYAFLQFVQRRLLEKMVNKKISEIGYTHLMINTSPVVEGKQFVGLRAHGVSYLASASTDEYHVEVTKYPKSSVVLYEYQFSDAENNILVVFNGTEPPEKGGVGVFVK